MTQLGVTLTQITPVLAGNYFYGVDVVAIYFLSLVVISPIHVLLLLGTRQIVLSKSVDYPEIVRVKILSLVAYFPLAYIAIALLVKDIELLNFIFVAVLLTKIGENMQTSYFALNHASGDYDTPFMQSIYSFSLATSLIVLCVYFKLPFEFVCGSTAFVTLFFGGKVFRYSNPGAVRLSCITVVLKADLMKLSISLGLAGFIGSMLVSYPKIVLSTYISAVDFVVFNSTLYVFVAGQILNIGILNVVLPIIKNTMLQKRRVLLFKITLYISITYGVAVGGMLVFKDVISLLLFGKVGVYDLYGTELPMLFCYIAVGLVSAFYEGMSTVYSCDRFVLIQNIILCLLILVISEKVISVYGIYGALSITLFVSMIKIILLAFKYSSFSSGGMSR